MSALCCGNVVRGRESMEKKQRDWGCNSVSRVLVQHEWSPALHNWVQTSVLHKLGVVVHTYNPSTWEEVEAHRPGITKQIWGHLGFHGPSLKKGGKIVPDTIEDRCLERLQVTDDPQKGNGFSQLAHGDLEWRESVDQREKLTVSFHLTSIGTTCSLNPSKKIHAVYMGENPSTGLDGQVWKVDWWASGGIWLKLQTAPCMWMLCHTAWQVLCA